MTNNTRPISITQKIDASENELWKIISKPGNLNYVHPYCKKNEIIEWNGEASEDVLRAVVLLAELTKNPVILPDNLEYFLSL